MEFSFDRSRSAQSGANDTQNQTQSSASGIRPGPDLNSVDPSTIANERLRKAIERNRSKQAAREASAPPQSRMAASANNHASPEARFSHMGSHFQNQSQTQFQAPPVPPQAPLFEERQQEQVEAQHSQKSEEAQAQAQFQFQRPVPEAAPLSTHERIMGQRDTTFESNYQTRAGTKAAAADRQAKVEVIEPEVTTASMRKPRSQASSTNLPAKSTTVVSRRGVANADNTEFVQEPKRTQRKVTSQINYNTNTARKKTQNVNPKYATYLIKGCWIFCALMVLRLIFASGGVTDYYSQKDVVSTKVKELESIQKDNSMLVREIERMKNDTGYQKKLVRDNLGFIAKDEFLVLFPKEQ